MALVIVEPTYLVKNLMNIKKNNTIIVPIIETKEAYEDLDNILKNKDVDAVFIGHMIFVRL